MEGTVGVLWAFAAWSSIPAQTDFGIPIEMMPVVLATAVAQMVLSWLLVALAVLDAENLWLPDKLTLPGIVLGLGWSVLQGQLAKEGADGFGKAGFPWLRALGKSALAAAVAAGLILLIWGVYRLIRRREGIGLGDAKLMALLAAWLGLPGALLAFVLGALIGATTAVGLLAVPDRSEQTWGLRKLPLGTFLCIGGIISSLWGQQILAAYLRWSGLRRF